MDFTLPWAVGLGGGLGAESGACPRPWAGTCFSVGEKERESRQAGAHEAGRQTGMAQTGSGAELTRSTVT